MTEPNPRPRTFNPNDHLIQLKSKEGAKDYLPVQFRLVWFRELCPQGVIETEEIVVDLDREMEEEIFVWNAEKRRSEKVVKRARGYARFRAIVFDGKGGKATGTKSECAASFPDYIEKAESGAIGRALGALGYGTQFAPEFNEEHRIVDSPVETHSDQGNERREEAKASSSTANTSERHTPTRTPASPNPSKNHPSTSSTISNEATITEQQVSSIKKLCEHLNKPVPINLETMGFATAKELVGTLSKEYREMQNKKYSNPGEDSTQPKEANTQATITLKPKEEESVPADPGDGEPVTPQEMAQALNAHFDVLGKYAYAEAKKESGVGDIKTKGDLKRVLFFCLKWENNGEFEEWKANPLLSAQMDEINGYCAPSSFGSVAVQRLQDRMEALKGKARGQFTREEADEFLGQLREKEPLYAISSYYDPDFAYLKRHYGLAHPLDWACATPRDENREGRYEGYISYLMIKIEQGNGIPRPLKKYTKAIGEMQDLVKLAEAS